jgi:hypothetical protein
MAFQLARRRRIVMLMVLMGSECGFLERVAWPWPLGDRECVS